MPDLINKIMSEYAVKNDEFYLRALGPYGVTRENLKDFAGRLEIKVVGSSPFGCVKNERVYLDGVKILDILETTIQEGFERVDGRLVMKYRIEKDVIWSRIEAECELKEKNNG